MGKSLSDELVEWYLNALADLELSINLEDRFAVTSRTIHQINGLLDSGRLDTDEKQQYTIIGFNYYRLKDDLLKALINKEGH